MPDRVIRFSFFGGVFLSCVLGIFSVYYLIVGDWKASAISIGITIVLLVAVFVIIAIAELRLSAPRDLVYNDGEPWLN